MWNNYLTVALRHILRQKGYAVINIAGLAIGIACCMLILLWVRFEYSFDTFHDKAGRIYRVAEETRRPDGFNRRRASSGSPLGPALAGEFPAIETAVRFLRTDALMSCQGNGFNETGLFFADPEVFQVFDFPLVAGNPKTALKEPFTAVITEEFARKYFGREDPLGKTVRYENQYDFTVTGILAPIPLNSHLRFGFLGSFSSFTSAWQGFAEHWEAPVWNYILLRPDVPPQQIESQLPPLVGRLRGPEAAATITLRLQPLLDIHLGSFLGGEVENKIEPKTLFYYALMAVLILAIASVNFVNLATARSSQRALEAGMRKVLGGSRTDLIMQYLGESILMSMMATLLALALVELFKPALSRLVGAQVSFAYLPQPFLWFGLAGIALAVGVAAGIFPAFHFSSASPAAALKGGAGRGAAGLLLRRILVIFQFSCAAVLLICTLIGFDQFHFLLNKDLGFDKNDLLVVPMTDPSISGKYDVLKNAFRQCEGVVAVGAASNIPGEDDCHGLAFQQLNGAGLLNAPVVWVDSDYPRTLGLTLVDGKDFIAEAPPGTVMLNQKAVTAFGFSDPIGAPLASYAGESEQLTPMYQSTIAGVVKDYNFRKLNNPIMPLVVMVDQRRCEYALVRLQPGNRGPTLEALKTVWAGLFPDRPFLYTFLDDFLAAQYRSTEHFATILNYACVLAVVVACIGLFGLASFVISRRTREIGIRLVFGASSVTIVSLLSREFLKTVAIANLIAWPVAYFIMTRWLQDFVYRITINPGIFLLSALVVLVIAFLTVAGHAVRAARANPVESLKYE
jgi:putative ABC transport system permease protein